MLTRAIRRHERRGPHTPWRHRSFQETWWNGCCGWVSGANWRNANSGAEYTAKVSAVLALVCLNHCILSPKPFREPAGRSAYRNDEYSELPCACHSLLIQLTIFPSIQKPRLSRSCFSCTLITFPPSLLPIPGYVHWAELRVRSPEARNAQGIVIVRHNARIRPVGLHCCKHK